MLSAQARGNVFWLIVHVWELQHFIHFGAALFPVLKDKQSNKSSTSFSFFLLSVQIKVCLHTILHSQFVFTVPLWLLHKKTLTLITIVDWKRKQLCEIPTWFDNVQLDWSFELDPRAHICIQQGHFKKIKTTLSLVRIDTNATHIA